ncbi:50S ribosomal protein L22 [Patescibacteria group bacterium]|nr:50S ribosomal protein L22 [Patescibacteria group bacterium]
MPNKANTTEIIATAKYIRQSPRKIMAVANLVRDLPLIEATEQLEVSIKRAAQPLYKVLMSAIANAKNNFGFEIENLNIKALQISPGPTIKRVSARAKGRSDVIKKRSSHIRVVLEKK